MMSSKKPTDMDNDEAATIIQSNYRRHLQSNTIKTLTENEAATVIQAAYRSYVARTSLSAQPQDETDEKEPESMKLEDVSPLENAENDDLREAHGDEKSRRKSQAEKNAEESGIDEVSITRVNSEPSKPYEGKRHSEEDAAIIIQRAYRNRASFLQRRSRSEAPQDIEILSHQSSVERSSSQVLQNAMEDEGSNILSREPSMTLGGNILSREPSTTLAGNIRSREPSAQLDELMPGGAPSRASSIQAPSRDPSAKVSKSMSGGPPSSASGSSKFSRKSSAISGGSIPSRKLSATLDTLMPGGSPSRASGSHMSSRELSATPSKLMSGSAHSRVPSASPDSPTPMEAVERMNTGELRGLAEEEAAVIIQRAYREHSSIHSSAYTPKPSISGSLQETEVTSRKASAEPKEERTSRKSSAKSEMEVTSRKSSAEPKEEITSRKSSAKLTSEITSRKVSAESKEEITSHKSSAKSTSSAIPAPVSGVEHDVTQEMETSRKSSAGVLDIPDFNKSLEAVENPSESPRTERPDEDELTEVPANYELGGDEIKLDDEKEETAEALEEADNDFVEGSLTQNEDSAKDDTETLSPEKSPHEIPDGETAEVESEDTEGLSSEKMDASDVTPESS
ncbi:hypothetical protein AAHC03_05755 [Spirometra sp. Aus1]